jgi:hypothetical protein
VLLPLDKKLTELLVEAVQKRNTHPNYEVLTNIHNVDILRTTKKVLKLILEANMSKTDIQPFRAVLYGAQMITTLLREARSTVEFAFETEAFKNEADELLAAILDNENRTLSIEDRETIVDEVMKEGLALEDIEDSTTASSSQTQ